MERGNGIEGTGSIGDGVRTTIADEGAGFMAYRAAEERGTGTGSEVTTSATTLESTCIERWLLQSINVKVTVVGINCGYGALVLNRRWN